MNADLVKRKLVDLDWNLEERRRMVEVLRYYAEHPECEADLAELDAVRDALKSDEGITEPVGGWEAYDSRLRSVVAVRRRRTWVQNVALAAAVIAISFLCGRLFHTGPPDDGSPQQPGPPLAFASQEIRSNTSMFREVADVFEQRASWVLISDDASDLGLSSDPRLSPDRLMLLRLAVVKGSEVVSSLDLVIVPGQTAELTVPFEGGRRLHYDITTSTDPASYLSLWAKLQSPDGGGRTLAALATEVALEPGKVFGAGEMATRTGNYALRIAFARAERTGQQA